MKDMQAVRFNEKLKRLSTLIGAGGLALILTVLTRLLDRALDLTRATWTIVGLALIWIGVELNGLLQPEDEL